MRKILYNGYNNRTLYVLYVDSDEDIFITKFKSFSSYICIECPYYKFDEEECHAHISEILYDIKCGDENLYPCSITDEVNKSLFINSLMRIHYEDNKKGRK